MAHIKLKYQKLIFNIYPKISHNTQDKDFDKTLSLIQYFKRKDFFLNGNRSYSITSMIFYTLSNTHHTEKFSNIEFIDLPKLFLEVGKNILQKLLT